jgi:hypothetical protein
MQIADRVTFHGFLADDRVRERSSDWLAGMALYEPSVADCVEYADPSKVKFYLELEVPVIMTDVTYLAERIRNAGAGAIVDTDIGNIWREIELLNRDFDRYLPGIRTLKREMEYRSAYDAGFSGILRSGAICK